MSSEGKRWWIRKSEEEPPVGNFIRRGPDTDWIEVAPASEVERLGDRLTNQEAWAESTLRHNEKIIQTAEATVERLERELAECREERDKWRKAHAEVCAESAHHQLDKRELEAELGKGHGLNLLRLAEKRAAEAERKLARGSEVLREVAHEDYPEANSGHRLEILQGLARAALDSITKEKG